MDYAEAERLLKTESLKYRGCIEMKFSVQPLFGTLECLRSEALRMRGVGRCRRKRLSPNSEPRNGLDMVAHRLCCLIKCGEAGLLFVFDKENNRETSV